MSPDPSASHDAVSPPVIPAKERRPCANRSRNPGPSTSLRYAQDKREAVRAESILSRVEAWMPDQSQTPDMIRGPA